MCLPTSSGESIWKWAFCIGDFPCWPPEKNMEPGNRELIDSWHQRRGSFCECPQPMLHCNVASHWLGAYKKWSLQGPVQASKIFQKYWNFCLFTNIENLYFNIYTHMTQCCKMFWWKNTTNVSIRNSLRKVKCTKKKNHMSSMLDPDLIKEDDLGWCW